MVCEQGEVAAQEVMTKLFSGINNSNTLLLDCAILDVTYRVHEKKTGDLRLCVDYRELNKKTTRDAYPLPLPDEVQDHLAKSAVFSTLDLQSGYWQLLVSIKDQEKTAFFLGPRMGVYQFCRMPFGLTGAPASFQRLMDKILRGLPFASTYIDDILVFSSDPIKHKEHLRQAFERLQEAGLTLRGKKCHIGLTQVTYLGHVFSAKCISPDPRKTLWPLLSGHGPQMLLKFDSL